VIRQEGTNYPVLSPNDVNASLDHVIVDYNDLSNGVLNEVSDTVDNKQKKFDEDATTAIADISKSLSDDDTQCHCPSMAKFCKLVHWRDPICSASVCGGILFTCICLSIFSVISILSYTGLVILLLNVVGRTYTHFVGSTDSLPEPLRKLLTSNVECSLSDDQVNEYSERAKNYLKTWSSHLIDLLTVKDYMQSLKFGAILYIMTYIGAWFNFLTLCILATIVVFAFPPIYELNKAHMDEFYALAKQHTCSYVKQLTDIVKNLPIFGKKEKST